VHPKAQRALDLRAHDALRLADLQRELEYRCVAGINSDTVDECFKRLQVLLGASGEKWNKVIARQPSSGDKA